MKDRLRFLSLALMLVFLGMQAVDGLAQDKNRKKKAWPDSLKMVTLEGTVLIDSNKT